MCYNRADKSSALFLYVRCLNVIKKKFRSKIKGVIQKIQNSFNDVLISAEGSVRVSTTELVGRIFSFVELFSATKMFPYQEQFSRRIIRSVLENDGEELTALFARQTGKTETVADTVSGLMVILPTLANLPMFADDPRLSQFTDGVWVGIFAPSLRQSQITYGRLKTRLQSKTAKAILEDPEFRLQFTTSNGQTVSLTNGSFATSISASDGSNIEGESFKLIICEEAQDISTFKLRKSIHPMGAAYNATIIKVGTATTFKGDFYEAIQRNKETAKVKSTHIKNHFEYDWTIAAKYNPKYLKYVEKEKKRLGEQSDEFQMSYCLKWILQRSTFVDIVAFEENNLETMLERTSYEKHRTLVAGIDVGGKGSDSTVVTIVEVDWNMPVIMEEKHNEETGEDETYLAYNTYVRDWIRIVGVDDYEEQYAIIMDYLSNFSISRVVVDATRESAIADRLRANLKCDVVSFIFTQKSKSELYKFLSTEIGAKRARVCAGEHTKETIEYQLFIQELADLQKGYSGTNMLVSHPNEKNAHDDFPDSWALAMWGTRSQAQAIHTETKDNPFNQTSSSSVIRRINKLTARRR